MAAPDTVEETREPAPLVDIRDLCKEFSRDRGNPVLQDVTLQVEQGELIAIVGPSGCGKSTLLNLLAKLSEPTSGAITMRDSAVVVGYVFQQPRLLPWRTVTRNVEFGLEQRGLGRKAIAERAQRAISQVRLDQHRERYPQELSGGMQQRVALARGLAIEPDLLLMDEPFGALDALTRSYMQDELVSLIRRTRGTTILVTHDIDEALLLGDRVVVMSSRPARIREIISVPFGERTLDSMIEHPDYAGLRRHIRDVLREEP